MYDAGPPELGRETAATNNGGLSDERHKPPIGQPRRRFQYTDMSSLLMSFLACDLHQCS